VERYANIYASKALPAWVQGIRDTNIYCQYLLQAHVGNMGQQDRTKALPIDYSVERISRAQPETFKIGAKIPGLSSQFYNDPEIVTRVTDRHKRFFGNFRKIASPAIQKFVDYITRDVNEKRLLADHVTKHNIDLADEEFKELAHLFGNKSVQLLETMEYFT